MNRDMNENELCEYLGKGESKRITSLPRGRERWLGQLYRKASNIKNIMGNLDNIKLKTFHPSEGNIKRQKMQTTE